MTDKVQIVCRGCNAKLAMVGTPDQIVNRKVRCPKCQMKFIARPEMISVATTAAVSPPVKLTAPTAAKPKPARPAEEIFDDVEDYDDVEVFDEEDDELPAAPRTSSTRPKRSSQRDELDELPAPAKKKKKKKSKPAPSRSFGTAVMLWTLGGIAGGFLGGGLWWVIAYATGWNVWYLSVLTGTFVGAGVRLGAAQYEGWMPAVTAVVIAIVAIFLSKFTLNYTVYFDDMPGLGGSMSHVASLAEEDVLVDFATTVVGEEYRKQGKPIEHPRLDEEDFDDYSEKGMLNPELWKEAETRWKAMPPQEQAAYRQNMVDRNLGIDRKSLIHHVAENEVKPEFTQAGKPVMLTEAELDAIDFETEFKPEVMQEAEARLDAKTPEQKAAIIATIRTQHETAEKAIAGLAFVVVLVGTILSFLWPSNLIALILACISAYQIGNYDGVTT